MSAPAKPPAFLDLAQIVAPFGVLGELKVKPETDDPLRLRDLKRVAALMPDGERRELEIERVHLRKDGVLLVKFVGIDSPEAGSTLRRAKLQIPFDQAKRTPGKVLYADVLGMQCVHDEDGRVLGLVQEVLRAGQDLLEVHTESGTDVLVPWVDVFVRSIDMETRIIRLTPPDGLFDDSVVEVVAPDA